jgi:hypothetical protein
MPSFTYEAAVVKIFIGRKDTENVFKYFIGEVVDGDLGGRPFGGRAP